MNGPAGDTSQPDVWLADLIDINGHLIDPPLLAAPNPVPPRRSARKPIRGRVAGRDTAGGDQCPYCTEPCQGCDEQAYTTGSDIPPHACHCDTGKVCYP